jgi:uncharacterized membrane protein YhhN
LIHLIKITTVKLPKFEKTFSALYFIIVIIELLSLTLSALSSFHNVAKPLILISLILFFYLKGDQLTSRTRRLMLFALTFSLIGDVLIIFEDISPNYFIGGLVAFLIAHSMYIMVFLDKRNSSQKPLFFITLLLIYVLGLFYIVKGGLGSMLLPVIIYVFAILIMAITASLRKGNVPTISYNLVLIGALLFVISDSFIAINKFYSAVPNEHILIMSTYALAQYCIVMGVLKQKS